MLLFISLFDAITWGSYVILVLKDQNKIKDLIEKSKLGRT